MMRVDDFKRILQAEFGNSTARKVTYGTINALSVAHDTAVNIPKSLTDFFSETKYFFTATLPKFFSEPKDSLFSRFRSAPIPVVEETEKPTEAKPTEVKPAEMTSFEKASLKASLYAFIRENANETAEYSKFLRDRNPASAAASSLGQGEWQNIAVLVSSRYDHTLPLPLTQHGVYLHSTASNLTGQDDKAAEAALNSAVETFKAIFGHDANSISAAALSVPQDLCDALVIAFTAIENNKLSLEKMNEAKRIVKADFIALRFVNAAIMNNLPAESAKKANLTDLCSFMQYVINGKTAKDTSVRYTDGVRRAILKENNTEAELISIFDKFCNELVLRVRGNPGACSTAVEKGEEMLSNARAESDEVCLGV